MATDQTDYLPGDTAQICASGFNSGDQIQFQVLHTDGTPNTGAGHDPWTVIDGSADDGDGIVDGNASTAWYVNPDDSAGSSFELTATDLNTGEVATADFTDALPNIGVASDTNSSSRTTVTVNATAAVPIGSTVIVAVSLNTTSSAAVSVSDASGNAYHRDVDVTNSNGVRMLVFSGLTATALPSGAAITVTTPSGISDKAMQVSALSSTMKYAEGSSSNTGDSVQPTVAAFSTTDSAATYTIFGAYGSVTSSSEYMFSNQGFGNVNGNPWSADGSIQSGLPATTDTGIVTGYSSMVGAHSITIGGWTTVGSIGSVRTGPPRSSPTIRSCSPARSPLRRTTPPTTRPDGRRGACTITGAASDTGGLGISQVVLTIKDTTGSQYWNGSAWTSTVTTIPIAVSGAPQSTPWTYNFTATAAQLTNGHSYTITEPDERRARELAGSHGHGIDDVDLRLRHHRTDLEHDRPARQQRGQRD